MNQLNRSLGRNAVLAASVAAGLLALSATGASAVFDNRLNLLERRNAAGPSDE